MSNAGDYWLRAVWKRLQRGLFAAVVWVVGGERLDRCHGAGLEREEKAKGIS